jgi:hypothetical protein
MAQDSSCTLLSGMKCKVLVTADQLSAAWQQHLQASAAVSSASMYLQVVTREVAPRHRIQQPIQPGSTPRGQAHQGACFYCTSSSLPLLHRRPACHGCHRPLSKRWWDILIAAVPSKAHDHDCFVQRRACDGTFWRSMPRAASPAGERTRTTASLKWPSTTCMHASVCRTSATSSASRLQRSLSGCVHRHSSSPFLEPTIAHSYSRRGRVSSYLSLPPIVHWQ